MRLPIKFSLNDSFTFVCLGVEIKVLIKHGLQKIITKTMRIERVVGGMPYIIIKK